MGQGVVHVLHVHDVVLLIPDAVLPGKQVREELKETPRWSHGRTRDFESTCFQLVPMQPDGSDTRNQ